MAKLKTIFYLFFNQILKIIFIILFILLLFIIDLKKIVIQIPGIHIFKLNINFIRYIFITLFPIILMIIILVLLISILSKIHIKFNKFTFCGLEIILNNPSNIVKIDIKNFLNTKRSLFFFNEKIDTISDVLNSYYLTYQFFRDEISKYENLKSSDFEYYNYINDVLVSLNIFLSKHQNNYNRWYNEIIKNNSSTDIVDIQKKYRYYDELLQDIKKVNTKMIIFAKKFDVDIVKWQSFL